MPEEHFLLYLYRILNREGFNIFIKRTESVLQNKMVATMLTDADKRNGLSNYLYESAANNVFQSKISGS